MPEGLRLSRAGMDDPSAGFIDILQDKPRFAFEANAAVESHDRRRIDKTTFSARRQRSAKVIEHAQAETTRWQILIYQLLEKLIHHFGGAAAVWPLQCGCT